MKYRDILLYHDRCQGLKKDQIINNVTSISANGGRYSESVLALGRLKFRKEEK